MVDDDSWGIITAKKTCPQAGGGGAGTAQVLLHVQLLFFNMHLHLLSDDSVPWPRWLSALETFVLVRTAAAAHPTKPQVSRSRHRSGCHPDTGSPQGVQAEISTIPQG